jgi:hypothetical protein
MSITGPTWDLKKEVSMDWKSLADKIAHWVLTLSSEPGELAELRRTGLHGAFSVPFLKLMVTVVEPLVPPPKSSDKRERYYRDFAIVARCAVLLARMHEQDASLGRTLAKTGYSEQRLLRLLRAKGEILEHEIGACALWLSRHEGEGHKIDLADIIALVMDEDTKWADDGRLAIARGYFREIEPMASGKKPQEEALGIHPTA